MRAAAQYGGSPAWVEPIYATAADMVYRLEFGLLVASDVPAPWDDLVIAAKAGLEGAKADRMKKSSGGSGGQVIKRASQTEREQAIRAAQERLKNKGA